MLPFTEEINKGQDRSRPPNTSLMLESSLKILTSRSTPKVENLPLDLQRESRSHELLHKTPTWYLH